MKDYTKRHMVVRLLPWWLGKIADGTYTLEKALRLLKEESSIRYVSGKDRKGLIQALTHEQEKAAGTLPAQ